MFERLTSALSKLHLVNRLAVSVRTLIYFTNMLIEKVLTSKILAIVATYRIVKQQRLGTKYGCSRDTEQYLYHPYEL